MCSSFQEKTNLIFPAESSDFKGNDAAGAYTTISAGRMGGYLPWSLMHIDPTDFIECPRTGDEILQHVIDTYEALPYILSPSERLMLKTNVISNHFSHVLNFPPMPRTGAAPEKWVLWAETNRKLTEKAARDIPDSQLGLRFASVMIPYNESTADYYETRVMEQQRLVQSYDSYCSKHGVGNKAASLDYQTVIWLDMECSTGYMTWRNSCESLIHDVCLWQKITKEDVHRNSSHYQSYIAAKLAKHIKQS